jgi:flavin reductase (DIM6/NTAB) family NADH-FMN oxidoreductase RutF
MTFDDSAFHDLVSGMDYPMFLVTAQAGAEMAGCLVGFVTQASIAPPRLLVMLSKANHTFRVAAASSMLGIHFLSADNRELARIFGELTGDDTDKFIGLDFFSGRGGTPVVRGTRGWIIGSVTSTSDCGDHVAYLVDVVEAGLDTPGPQLGFAQVRHFHPGHPA